MSESRNWDQEYDNILLKHGERAGEEPSAERRQHPRFEISSRGMSANIDTDIELQNISATGVAFSSTVPYPPGSEFPVSVNDLFTIQATVIDCEIFEADPDFMDFRYRVRCVIRDQELGRRTIVLMRRQGNL